jgi:hypothetical protein
LIRFIKQNKVDPEFKKGKQDKNWIRPNSKNKKRNPITKLRFPKKTINPKIFPKLLLYELVLAAQRTL